MVNVSDKIVIYEKFVHFPHLLGFVDYLFISDCTACNLNCCSSPRRVLSTNNDPVLGLQVCRSAGLPDNRMRMTYFT